MFLKVFLVSYYFPEKIEFILSNFVRHEKKQKNR